MIVMERERIEAIKNSIDIKSYIESRGVSLKKNGQNYVALCPFHSEKTPSFSVNSEKQLFNCFSCGKAGDVFNFSMYLDSVNFVEAVKLVGKNSSSLSLPSKPITKKSKELLKLPESTIQKLLERTITIYENNDNGRKYLEQRGIKDAVLFINHRIGYCDGKIKEILPKDGDIRKQLNQLGILMQNDYERFTDCLVVPVFDIDDNITTLYGRSSNGKSNPHMFLPNRSTGLWNIRIIREYSKIIIVESIIDGLSVMTSGYPNVIAVQGTNGLLDADISLLKQNRIQEIILLFDGDEPGKKAVERLKEKLSGFSYEVKTFPNNHDPNSYLMEYGAEKLGEFIQSEGIKPVIESSSIPVSPEIQVTKESEPVIKSPSVPVIPPTPVNKFEILPDGFAVTYGLRRYMVLNLEKGSRKLRATVRLECGGKQPYADTINFYSARDRRSIAQDICRVFNEVTDTIESDITRLMLECEKFEKRSETAENADQKTIVEQMSEAERIDAETFGKSPDLIKLILNDFEKCGLLGEESNKILIYVAMTSRKRKMPLAVLHIASAGAGKTAMQEGAVGFCPPEDVVKRTILSGKALFYKGQDSLKHKVLALEEGDGADEAAYAIRSLISSGVLIVETTIKDLATGRLTTMENRVEGPTAVFFTTTNPDVDPETKSRFIVTGVDESKKQTQKILEFQRKQDLTDDLIESVEKDEIIKRHHNFQRLLQPIGVKNPYSEQLTYGDDRLQGRRDQPKYLALIKGVAFMRQMQKEIKYELKNGTKIPYIDVDLVDIKIANNLTHEILGKSLDELSGPARYLLIKLDEMVEHLFKKMHGNDKSSRQKRTDISFTRRDIREFTGWLNPRVHRYLRELLELEYLQIVAGKNGKKYTYKLTYEGQGKNGEKFVLGLTSVEDFV